MKALRTGLILLACTVLGTLSLFAQCEPDTDNCKDEDDNPGQMCPQVLDEATVNIWYEEVITVIPPSEFHLGASVIYINYIEIDSITSLPEGLDWEANSEPFYADSAYCVLISGIPLEAGTDTLGIYVTPYIYVGSATVPGPPQADDSTIVMTVNAASGIDPSRLLEFQVLPNIPNPFTDITRIGFYTPFDRQVQLRVYDILGTLVHEEERGFSPGEHFFDFKGQALKPGTYFYRLSNQEVFYTGKFIKAGR